MNSYIWIHKLIYEFWIYTFEFIYMNSYDSGWWYSYIHIFISHMNSHVYEFIYWLYGFIYMNSHNDYMDSYVGWRFSAALLPRLFWKNPRSHHKGATCRVWTVYEFTYVNSYDFFIYAFICFMNSYMNSDVPRFQMPCRGPGGWWPGPWDDHASDVSGPGGDAQCCHLRLFQPWPYKSVVVHVW